MGLQQGCEQHEGRNPSCFALNLIRTQNLRYSAKGQTQQPMAVAITPPLAPHFAWILLPLKM